MKNPLKIAVILLIILNALVLIGCKNPKYKVIGQDIIDGKVSATQKGVRRYGRGAIDEYPVIWVQNATKTQMVIIPFEYENKWKVGDSCLLIIEKHLKLE